MATAAKLLLAALTAATLVTLAAMMTVSVSATGPKATSTAGQPQPDR